MATIPTVTVDRAGGLTRPPSLCQMLGIEPGDAFVVAADEQGLVLRPVQREDPFAVLAAHALAEYRAGRTQNLRDFAAAQGNDQDG